MDEEVIAKNVVDAAIQIHRALGPGLLESVYEVVLADELMARGLAVNRQVPVAIKYRDRVFQEAFRADIIVGNLVILELKSITQLNSLHQKQLHTYLRLSDKRLGLLLNFGAELMKHGIKRVVNGLPEN